MSAQQQTSQEEAKPSDKELNFRALEQKYQRQLDQERQARSELEKENQRLASERKPMIEEDDSDDDLVDKKKLHKTLARFGEQTQKVTKSEIQQSVQAALAEERQRNWVKSNPDFYDVLQHAEKLAMKDPELAETILEMPEGFERQKLVYKTIKSQGLHKPEERQPSIQEKVDANRKGPYYQPSGVGTAPYQSAGDYSKSGQEQAYKKMQELKGRLRI